MTSTLQDRDESSAVAALVLRGQSPAWTILLRPSQTGRASVSKDLLDSPSRLYTIPPTANDRVEAAER